DGDRRITVRDEGAGWFDIPLKGGTSYRVEGTYYLANLVQELFLAHQEGRATISLRHVEEAAPERISRLIREFYWAGLTRQIGNSTHSTLADVLADSKTDSMRRAATSDEWPTDCTRRPVATLPQFLYVPHTDPEAFTYYRSLAAHHPSVVVCRMPESITPRWVASLSATETRGSRHGLLSLALRRSGGRLEPIPYVVPGGRFNELYGWDSYFHVLGLLADGKAPLARDVVDNQLYEVRHYGKVLNANRTYYLTRSQPPLLSSSVRALWESKATRDVAWLRAALDDLIREYSAVWNGAERLTPLCQAVPGGADVCLATYASGGLGEPPEVEPGHFAWLFQRVAEKYQRTPETYRLKYQRRELPPAELDELDWHFMHDGAMRESGHDTTYRWFTGEGDRCADFATIDLNALLFKVELDLAHLTQQAGSGDAQKWCDRALARRDLVQKHLYDGELFVDYQLRRDDRRRFVAEGKQSSYVSATTLYPLWASAQSPCRDARGTPLALVSDPEQTRRLVRSALALLEAPGGLLATARASVESAPRATQRQWDYPFGWAPHQILAWEGLARHGYTQEANRLVYRWLYMISTNVRDYHGTVPEKFDVVRRSHEVFAEYGNVGSEFRYITREGFGWMNASFQLGRKAASREAVGATAPPGPTRRNRRTEVRWVKVAVSCDRLSRTARCRWEAACWSPSPSSHRGLR
ncbi:MAG TPA: trehalase family glycosidase, partial [Polyangiaceae bacterium]|nr:trehalase family glycosidase [Polyangiaceae bacterium]